MNVDMDVTRELVLQRVLGVVIQDSVGESVEMLPLLITTHAYPFRPVTEGGGCEQSESEQEEETDVDDPDYSDNNELSDHDSASNIGSPPNTIPTPNSASDTDSDNEQTRITPHSESGDSLFRQEIAEGDIVVVAVASRTQGASLGGEIGRCWRSQPSPTDIDEWCKESVERSGRRRQLPGECKYQLTYTHTMLHCTCLIQCTEPLS